MAGSKIVLNRHVFVSIFIQEIEETKTCRFRTILDSATHSTSCKKFFEIHFHCGESPTLLPLKTLILTAPANIVYNCLPLQFCWQFSFAYTSLTSSQKNLQLEQDVNQVLFSDMGDRQFHNKHHGDTMPKQTRDMFLFSLCINTKGRTTKGSVL